MKSGNLDKMIASNSYNTASERMRLSELSVMGSRVGAAMEVEEQGWPDRNPTMNDFASTIYPVDNSLSGGMANDYTSASIGLTPPCAQYADTMSSLSAVTRNTPGYIATGESHEVNSFYNKNFRLQRKFVEHSNAYGTGLAQHLASTDNKFYDSNFIRASTATGSDLSASIVTASTGYLPAEFTPTHNSKTPNSFAKYDDEPRAGVVEYKHSPGCGLETPGYPAHAESYSKVKHEKEDYAIIPCGLDANVSKMHQMTELYTNQKSPNCYRSPPNLVAASRPPMQQPSPVEDRALSINERGLRDATEDHYPLEASAHCEPSRENQKNVYAEQKSSALLSAEVAVDLHRSHPGSERLQDGENGRLDATS